MGLFYKKMRWMEMKYYYMKKYGDQTDLYIPGDEIVKVYPRKDVIISSKYNSEKDETTIKAMKR